MTLNWSNALPAASWVDEILDELKIKGGDKDYIKEIQDYFMTMNPKQKATAFIYLLGRVVREYE